VIIITGLNHGKLSQAPESDFEEFFDGD